MQWISTYINVLIFYKIKYSIGVKDRKILTFFLIKYKGKWSNWKAKKKNLEDWNWRVLGRIKRDKNGVDGTTKGIWKRPPGLLNRFSIFLAFFSFSFLSTCSTLHYKSVSSSLVTPWDSFHLILFIGNFFTLLAASFKKYIKYL